MEEQFADLKERVKKLESCEQGILGGSKQRDRYIIFTFVVLVLYMFYQWYEQTSVKDHLDNRMRWPLGGLRDDTGATNPMSIFGRGYGLDESKNGAKVLEDGFGLAFGQSTYTSKDGKVQSEYGNLLGDKQNFANPFHVMSQRPVKPALEMSNPLPFLKKEHLDKKRDREHLDQKTTDQYLESRLYGTQ